MDTYAPTDGDKKDTIPPYIGGGHCGRPMNLSNTEEVAGSSPVPPTNQNPTALHTCRAVIGYAPF